MVTYKLLPTTLAFSVLPKREDGAPDLSKLHHSALPGQGLLVELLGHPSNIHALVKVISTPFVPEGQTRVEYR